MGKTDVYDQEIRDMIADTADKLLGSPAPDPDLERADNLFDQMIQYAEAAAALDNAAGYSAAMNTLRFAVGVLNPAKYGTKVVSKDGAVEGYIIETGIRRGADPGFEHAGALPNEPSQDHDDPPDDPSLG